MAVYLGGVKKPMRSGLSHQGNVVDCNKDEAVRITLVDGTTYRPRTNAGDYLLWIRCIAPLSAPPTFGIVDFWAFRNRDAVLITNRKEDYPAPLEQGEEEEGPNLWKIVPGDRLVWVGWRRRSGQQAPALLALINCDVRGYVYGEPNSPSLGSIMSFGAPATSELSAKTEILWSLGYNAAVSLGVPRIWAPPT
jgi:hypothetical protein